MQVTEKGKNGRLEWKVRISNEEKGGGKEGRTKHSIRVRKRGKERGRWDQGQVGHTERESKTGNIEGKER